MSLIDPKPFLTNSITIENFPWPIKAVFDCPAISYPKNSQSFTSIVESRRSERCMKTVALTAIANVLGYSMRPRFYRVDDALCRTKRPSISAGALHPVNVLIIVGRDACQVYRYEPLKHQLQELWLDPLVLNNFFRKCISILPDANGAALVFVADTEKTKKVYCNFESLVWRDAGALLQLIAMASVAYDLAFCPLGILGGEVVELLDGKNRLLAAGAAMIGEPCEVKSANQPPVSF